jgi:catechol 2,3-dioxygenase
MSALPMALLPAETTLGPVRLQVADLDRSIAYYRGILGFRVGETSASVATLTAHQDETPLVLLEAYPGAAPAPRRGRLGLYHFAILLPDRAALGRFVSHLGGSAIRVGASDHLVSEALYLTDPDGLGIEVYADRPRSQWQWRDGELVMATDPLDLDAVVAAAGGERWEGMPPGTRVGHVHLHVGALPEGEAFYRSALGLEPTAWGSTLGPGPQRSPPGPATPGCWNGTSSYPPPRTRTRLRAGSAQRGTPLPPWTAAGC